MNFLKILMSGLIVLLFVTAGLFAQNVNVGSAAPSFQLSKFGGGTVSMSDYPDQIIMLNFLGSY